MNEDPVAKNAFEHQVRVVMCPACGAPYQVLPMGGAVRCRFCEATAQLAPRKAALRSDRALSESERFEKLRRADGKPLLPPKPVMRYMRAGGLDPTQADAALGDWQRLCTELRGGASFACAERLYFLTLLLAQYHGQRDPVTQRGLLETALELLDDRRQRQVLMAVLCRCAVRAGQLDDAERWLSGCDSRSDDLYMDTAWRHAQALLELARGDFKAVLRTLGRTLDEVPIADTEDEAVGVLRAAAHERLGDVELAVAQLTRLAKRSRQAPAVIAKVIAFNTGLSLCSVSWPRVLETVPGVRSASEGAGPGCGVWGCAMVFPVVFFGGATVFCGIGGSALVQAVGVGLFGWPGPTPEWVLAIVFSGVGVLFGAFGLMSSLGVARSWWSTRAPTR